MLSLYTHTLSLLFGEVEVDTNKLFCEKFQKCCLVWLKFEVCHLLQSVLKYQSLVQDGSVAVMLNILAELLSFYIVISKHMTFLMGLLSKCDPLDLTCY
jgi:hypothetical protein